MHFAAFSCRFSFVSPLIVFGCCCCCWVLLRVVACCCCPCSAFSFVLYKRTPFQQDSFTSARKDRRPLIGAPFSPVRYYLVVTITDDIKSTALKLLSTRSQIVFGQVLANCPENPPAFPLQKAICLHGGLKLPFNRSQIALKLL